MKEAGWTAEEDESKPRFLLVVDGERCEQNPEVRRRFMAQVCPGCPSLPPSPPSPGRQSSLCGCLLCFVTILGLISFQIQLGVTEFSTREGFYLLES